MDKKSRHGPLIIALLTGLSCATLQSRDAGFVRLECPPSSVPHGVDRDEMWCEDSSGRKVGPHATWEGGVYLYQFEELDASGVTNGYRIQFIDGTPSMCGQFEAGVPCGSHYRYKVDSSLKEKTDHSKCGSKHEFPLPRWEACIGLIGAGSPI